jgi:hypothetical protein
MHPLLSASLLALVAAAPLSAQDVVLTTASGTTGADSFIQFGVPDSNFGTQTSVVVKYGGSNTATTNRKIYLRFDTATLQKPAAVAKLDLTVALNNGGGSGAAAVPNAQNFTLAIYGLNDGATAGNGFLGEDWSETELTWNNAPANILSGTGAGNAVREGTSITDGGEATLLGSFSVTDTQGAGVLAMALEGQTLVDFLNADTNGLATFIITRTGWSLGQGSPTTSQGSSNLVFHSKEGANPDFAPTLTVTPGAATDFRILSITYPTPGTGALITWRSVVGRTYSIQTSTDLADWSAEVVDGWPAGGATEDTVSYEDTDFAPGSPIRYYRVREE